MFISLSFLLKSFFYLFLQKCLARINVPQSLWAFTINRGVLLVLKIGLSTLAEYFIYWLRWILSWRDNSFQLEKQCIDLNRSSCDGTKHLEREWKSQIWSHNRQQCIPSTNAVGGQIDPAVAGWCISYKGLGSWAHNLQQKLLLIFAIRWPVLKWQAHTQPSLSEFKLREELFLV